MSRDRSHDRDDAAAAKRDGERDLELLTAYVDGVAELSPDDRRRVGARLASDPQASADETATRALLGRLRALPPEGEEPDWAAMERSIRDAVGSEVPRPWWRAWRWLVPVMTCATAAAVMLMLWPSSGPTRAPVLDREQPVASSPHPQPQPAEASDETAAIVPLWLDGAEVDVDLSAAEMLRGPGTGDDDPGRSDEADEHGVDGADVALLPAADLGWVDHLDDAAISRAERWLSSARDSGGSGGATPATPARKRS
jgi:hypothetical protein